MKDIPGYEGRYAVTEDGKVFTHKRQKFLKHQKTQFGYYSVQIYKNGKKKTVFVHKLVALTYLDNTEKKIWVNHKNGIKTDNCVCNLEWCTPSENIKHAYDIGLKFSTNKHIFRTNHPSKGIFGEKNKSAKKITQYDMNGKQIREWGSIIDASRELSLLSEKISMCCNGKRKSHGGYIWKFLIF